MSVEDKVTEIISRQLEVKPEDITSESKLVEDLGVDSLDTIELLMAFEEEFGFEIPDEDADQLRTIGDIIEYLKKRSSEPL